MKVKVSRELKQIINILCTNRNFISFTITQFKFENWNFEAEFKSDNLGQRLIISLKRKAMAGSQI